MNLDDMPAPAVVDEEKAVIDDEITVVEYVPPTSPRPVEKPRSAPPKHAAPDPFAVGVRVLKMAPAWLLFITVCCSGVVLALGWMRSGGEAAAVTLPSKHNDARAAKPAPAAEETSAKAEAVSPATASPAVASGQKTTAANDAPAQPPAPAPTPQPAPAVAPKTEEKPRVETPAPVVDSGGKFTAQVGSFNSQSEANERVSSLRAAGFEAHVAAAELPGRGTWYRVQVGRFADRGEASKTAAALRAKGAATAALVVPLQK
ncbi:MAG: SPOR domain-containing protein [Pyrinomonadaceae bacterium]